MSDKSGAEKTGTIIYNDLLEKCKRMTDEQFGQTIRLILQYAKTQQQPDINDPLIGMAFDFIQPSIDKDIESYKETCKKNKEAAEKRWGKKNADAPARMPNDTDENNRSARDADASNRMPSDADENNRSASKSDTNDHIPSDADASNHIPSDADENNRSASKSDTNDHIPSDADASNRMPSDADASYRMPSDADASYRMPSDANAYDRIPNDAKYADTDTVTDTDTDIATLNEMNTTATTGARKESTMRKIGEEYRQAFGNLNDETVIKLGSLVVSYGARDVTAAIETAAKRDPLPEHPPNYIAKVCADWLEQRERLAAGGNAS